MPSASWTNGWATADVVTAAELMKSMGAIYDTTLGAAAATIDITGIVATYAHLLLVLYARGDIAATADSITCRFNGDTAANYDYQVHTAVAATVSASEVFAATSIGQAGGMPAATAGANLFSVTEILIPHYAGSTNNKTMQASSSWKTGTATTNINQRPCSGFWRSSAAINRITLGSAGNFAIGTRATLYAMGA